MAQVGDVVCTIDGYEAKIVDIATIRRFRSFWMRYEDIGKDSMRLWLHEHDYATNYKKYRCGDEAIGYCEMINEGSYPVGMLVYALYSTPQKRVVGYDEMLEIMQKELERKL